MTPRPRPPLPTAPEFGAPVPQAGSPETLDFLARRRSASALTLAAPGPSREDLADLIRLAARVPDHGKLAPWRFLILAGADKTAFADALEGLALAQGDARAAGKLGKLRTPPACIAVISSPKPGDIPEWEQRLSAGAVCSTLLYAATAMGFGANWITDWYAYDAGACARLGLSGDEKVAGFILLGTPAEAPRERERPDPAALTARWRP
jgi:nitroreductase